MSQAATWATMLGLAGMSDPPIKKRRDQAVGFLETVLSCQLAAQAPWASVRGPPSAGRIGIGE